MSILDRCVKAAHSQRSHLALSCPQQCRLGTIILKYGVEESIFKKLPTPGIAFFFLFYFLMGFPDSSIGDETTCNARDPSSVPGFGRSPGEGTGYPLQYSWVSLIAQLVKNPPAMQESWVQSLGWEDPLEKGKAINSSILA